MDRNSVPFRPASHLSKVALRKESVDRNMPFDVIRPAIDVSLSARRAWIEIRDLDGAYIVDSGRSPQGERG